MTDIRMPDGQVVRFPDDMPREQITAIIQQKMGQANAAPAEPAPTPAAEPAAAPERPWWAPRNTIGDAVYQLTGGADESLGESYAGQGISGVNEGILNLAGAPVDLFRMGVNAGIGGINSLAGTSIPQFSDQTFGGSEHLKGMFGPRFMAPPTDDAGKQVVRRIGQEVGASVIPGLSVAARSARPVATLGSATAASLGSGAGGAVAQQAFPGNPMAEMAGQVLGGITPGGLASGLRRAAPAPSTGPALDAVRQNKTAAYQAADALGVRYSARGYDDLTNSIQAAATRDNISATRHPRATSMIQEITNAPAGHAPTLTEMDQLRQVVYRDLVKSPDESERHFGQLIIDQIDDFIDSASGVQLAAGAGPDGARAITAAREANKVYRRTQILDELLDAAELRTAATGSGGNINNAIKQRLASILTDPRKRRNFTTEQQAEIRSVVQQGKMEDIMRLVGKLSPSGNGLMAILSILGTVANPMVAAVPLTGMAAKAIADRGTVTKATDLRNTIASGGARPSRPFVTGPQRDAAGGLAAGQVANQAANDNNATMTALGAWGYDDLVAAVRSGQMSMQDAFNAAMGRQRASMAMN